MAQIAGNRGSWDQARMYIVVKARDSGFEDGVDNSPASIVDSREGDSRIGGACLAAATAGKAL